MLSDFQFIGNTGCIAIKQSIYIINMNESNTVEITTQRSSNFRRVRDDAVLNVTTAVTFSMTYSIQQF